MKPAIIKFLNIILSPYKLLLTKTNLSQTNFKLKWKIGLRNKIIPLYLCLFIFNCNTKNPNNIAATLLNGLSDQFYYNLSEPSSNNLSEKTITEMLFILDSAKSSSYCIFQDLDEPRIISKLRELALKKIDVKVALDEDNRLGIGYFQLSEFLPTTGENRKLWIGNKGEPEVYLNFCLVDQVRVYFSTSPFTLLSLNGSPFLSGYIQSFEDGIVKKFGTEADLILHGSFGASKQRLNQRNHWLIGGTDVGIYMAPEEDPISFMSSRISDAQYSQRSFTTEFFSNKRNSASSIRTDSDLAYENVKSNAPYKLNIVSWSGDLNPDPDAEGSCEFNTYLNLACDTTKSAGTSGESPRKINSSFYLRKAGLKTPIYANSKPKHALSILLLDSGHATNKTFIGSAPFSARTDSGHDGFFFHFEDRPNSDRISDFFQILNNNTLEENSIVGNSETDFMSVIVSEINWMGSAGNTGKDTSSEWIELFNNKSVPINISDWKIQCGNSGSFTSILTFPKRSIIGAKQYFVAANDSEDTIKEPHLKITFGSSNAINDTKTDQCRILDNAGRIIDVAGVSGIPFIEFQDNFGRIDIEGKTIRSMERLKSDISGESISNWQTNSNSYFYYNANIGDEYFQKTFGSPGYSNSKKGSVPHSEKSLARSLVINELSRNSSDTYVEIYNPLDVDINLKTNEVFFNRSSNCSISSGSWSESLELTGTIPAKGYYLLSRSGHTHASIADNVSLGSLSSSYCVSLSIRKSLSGLNHPALIDFLNLGANSISSVGGTYVTDTIVQRCENGRKTNVFSNSSDFSLVTSISPRSVNVCN